MKALPVPLDESYFPAYQKQLDFIVKSHMARQEEKLKNTASTAGSEQAADAEVNKSNVSSGTLSLGI
jgi:hypothetical protein